jgi:hypothetical protein
VVGALAASQHSIVTRQQLLAAGLGGGAIDSWLRRGRLYSRHRGVYAVGHPGTMPLSDEMAAALACGAQALVSHSSAAHLWGLRPPSADGVVHITVPGRHVGHRAGIRVHRVDELGSPDRRLLQRVPLTSPARTLLDVAPSLTARELELAVDEAIVRQIVTRGAIRAALSRYPGRRGCAALAELVIAARATTATRSEAEERFLALVRRARLSPPEVNVRTAPTRWTSSGASSAWSSRSTA